MRKTIWDAATLFIFERGITFRRVDDAWSCVTVVEDLLIISPSEFATKTRMLPIYAEVPIPPITITHILSQDGSRAFDLQVQDAIYKRSWDSTEYIRLLQIRNVEYCHLLLLHELKRLAMAYSNTLEMIHQFPTQTAVQFLLGNSFVVYFAFDGVVTAAIRALDSLRPYLWYGFGERGQMSNSFFRTVETSTRLPHRISRIVDTLRPRLTDAKAYRDCIQHYFSPGLHTDSLQIDKHDPGFLTLSAWIPDSAASRATSQFRYAKNLDALSFSWDLVSDIILLLTAIAEELPDPKSHSDRV